MPRGRGGKRTPVDPAPQTNLPGRLAERSDTGVPSQLPFNAEQHGDRAEFAAHQDAGAPGPGAASGPPVPSSSAGGPPPGQGGAPVPLPDVFAPGSGAPASPASMTIGPDGRMVDDDPDLLLRVLYTQFPHPDILRLIQKRKL